MRWRWLEDSSPRSPWENMARDEALLTELQHNAAAMPIVRAYCWDRQSVSIGRLQDESAVREMYPGLPLVRRPTGGRAVVHGGDLTVTVVVRASDLPMTEVKGVLASYRQIVVGVVEAFCCVGISATLGRTKGLQGSIGDVDCFALAAPCDIIAEESGRKIAGCAQRRQNGFILQQMSIPLIGLPDKSVFLHSIREGFARNLGVSEWTIG